jgi:hypothetical protein
MTNRPRRNSFKAFNNFDDLFGHYYFDKIVFIPEILDEKIFKYLINQKDNMSNMLINDHVKTLTSYVKALFNKENINLLLFTKTKYIKILSLKNEDFDYNIVKLKDIEEPLNKLLIHRLNKNVIGEKAYSSFTSKEIDTFNNSQFYILELKNRSVSPMNKDYNNTYNKENNTKFSDNFMFNKDSQNQGNSVYYLIRILNENTERFEIACDTLKLYIPNADRENNAFKKKNTYLLMFIIELILMGKT